MPSILDRPESDRDRSGPAHPSDGAAVLTRGLSKDYRNPWTLKVTPGLIDLDLEVRRGEVFGYLGPNGAGKTTTLKILCGLLKASRGGAWLMGEPVTQVTSRRRLGFLPEQPYFYDYLTGPEYLELVGRLSGLTGQEASRAAREWLGRVGLGERSRLRLRKYSKGMLQRLGLAAALVHAPDLLILDEPMSGLDPFGRRDVRELILEQRERGTTVLFSSHILPDVELLCDRVGIVLAGQLTRVATVRELVHQGRHRVEIRCDGNPLVEIPPAWNEILTRVDRASETTFVLTEDERLQEVLAWLIQRHVALRAVTPHRRSLEELFMEAATSSRPAADDRRIA
jgi:ABC-2 type transport system ATP-binding protein